MMVMKIGWEIIGEREREMSELPSRLSGHTTVTNYQYLFFQDENLLEMNPTDVLWSNKRGKKRKSSIKIEGSKDEDKKFPQKPLRQRMVVKVHALFHFFHPFPHFLHLVLPGSFDIYEQVLQENKTC